MGAGHPVTEIQSAMSLHTLEKIQCPECGHSQEMLVWQSLNVSLDPEAQKDLLEGKINVLDCSKCHHKTFINTPFVYHDMHLEFYIDYVPFEQIGSNDFFLKYTFHPDGFPSMEEQEDMGIPSDCYLRTPHIVFDMQELVRYVIFRELLAESLSENSGV